MCDAVFRCGGRECSRVRTVFGNFGLQQRIRADVNFISKGAHFVAINRLHTESPFFFNFVSPVSTWSVSWRRVYSSLLSVSVCFTASPSELFLSVCSLSAPSFFFFFLFAMLSALTFRVLCSRGGLVRRYAHLRALTRCTAAPFTLSRIPRATRSLHSSLVRVRRGYTLDTWLRRGRLVGGNSWRLISPSTGLGRASCERARWFGSVVVR